MKKLLVAAAAFIVAGSLACTPALTQDATKTEEAKTAKPAEAQQEETKQEETKAKESAAPTSAEAKRAVTRRPEATSKRSVGARTAACKADCSAGHLHGAYRAYGTSDPNLVSPEGRKLYAECVRLCLDPLPEFYFQKSIVESGGSWFGKTKSDCLECHAVGKPKRFWPGINTLPDNLKRDSATR
jgi:hypothetical protein